MNQKEASLPPFFFTPWLGGVALFFLAALTIAGPAVRLCSPLILAIALWKLTRQGNFRLRCRPLILVALVFLVPALQLVPLPPVIWTALPGRGFVIEAFSALNAPLPWMPVSLSPQATLTSIITLLPAAALFCACLTFSPQERNSLVPILIIATFASVMLGMAQKVSPSLRFSTLNTMYSTGFYFNRNHFAALLYGSISFSVGYLLILNKNKYNLVIGFSFILFVFIGIALSGSRSGLAFGVTSLVLSVIAFLVSNKHENYRLTRISLCVIIISTLMSVAFIGYFLFDRILARFSGGLFADGRFDYGPVGITAIKDFFPAGTGLGTFADVFLLYQNADNMTSYYINELHNDWLQIPLEGGLLAIIVMMTIIIWICLNTWRVWRSHEDGSVFVFAKAGTITIFLLIIHALFEYHMRSTAISSVFSLCCALLINSNKANHKIY